MEGLISIIIPCRNEELFIKSCLDSVLAFELPNNIQIEVLVLDGRSADRTRYIVDEISARDPRIRFLDNPGITQSSALNIGICRSRGRWLMRLDAHTRYPSNYLIECHGTALRTGAANIGGVCVTEPGGTTYEAKLVAALTTHRFGVGNSGFRVGASEGPRDTVPFGFFQRDLFEEIGFFDERLVRAQDFEFNCRIRASGRVVWLNPKIHSFYFNQPRIVGFYQKQFEKEAPYNAYLWFLAPYAFTPRHAITGVFAFGVILGFILALYSSWCAWAFVATLALYAILAVGSALQQAIRYRCPLHALCLPPCFFLFHFIHGLGVLMGLSRLALGSAPVQQHSEPWSGANRFRAWPLPTSNDESGQNEELRRYNRRARTALAAGNSENLRQNGAGGVEVRFRAPYLAYHRELKTVAKPGLKMLDICCGDGLHSLTGAIAGAELHALDAAQQALTLAKQRASLAGTTIAVIHGTAENLPFADRTFDVISCAGGLSYLDFEQFIKEARRVLAPSGVFICVDSFNENWIYRLNRYAHYLRGDRSKGTLKRMPDEQTLTRLRAAFSEVRVEYFGVLIFALPFVGLFCSDAAQARFITKTDRLLRRFRTYSFKVVIRASGPRHP